MITQPKLQICSGREFSTSKGTIASASETTPRTRLPTANHTATRLSDAVPRTRGPNTSSPTVPAAKSARTTRWEGEYGVNVADLLAAPARAGRGTRERQPPGLAGWPPRGPQPRTHVAHHVVLGHQDVAHDHDPQVQLSGHPQSDGDPVEAGLPTAGRVEILREEPPDGREVEDLPGLPDQ